VRVFVALDVPDDVRRALCEFSGKLANVCPGARWANVEGIHVTLKFIGEASPEKVERIQKALAGVHSADAVEMLFRNVGFFPNAHHPRVFWAGIDASPNLAGLAADIEQSLEPLGIEREARPFRPHLTLARFKSEEGLARLHETLKLEASREFGATRALQFRLYQSVLKRGGAEYTPLVDYPFVRSGS
jgi:2'-5' RNA ligase